MTKILHYQDLKPLGIPHSKSQLARMEKAGLFVRRVRLSAQVYGWPADDIESWLKARIAERDGVQHAA
jgi:prophage regulatory protein